ncbi:uncharacterized protein IL334_000070 [Kwoniella shivajii]|uniref:Rhodanese domain-containing protein n=1 Tax=Kwoniella shivajii TaxID=564305 RepID=A0ABZ1CP82_9TREE|nr:hypothetical protein IL334_000070 [Kwoniella shivajii]
MSSPSAKSKIEIYLEEKRKNVLRLDPKEAFEQVGKKDGAIMIDTRPCSFREKEGSIPGAIIIERNVLEWRLDPTSPDNIPEAKQANFKPIIVCNEGYASSLAASSLIEIGIKTATDLKGGFIAWKNQGYPVDP